MIGVSLSREAAHTDMNGTLHDDRIAVGGDAKQRYYDGRGYGRPIGGNEIELSRVEAAHLLFRGDLEAVVTDTGATLSFKSFFTQSARTDSGFAQRFLVYADLRDRGFYLSPALDGWPGEDTNEAVDFTVYPRGKGPTDTAVKYRITVVGERKPIPAAELAGLVLAVVDEESELTYLESAEPSFDGSSLYDPETTIEGALIGDRVICWDAPEHVYETGFYGQPLSGRAAIIDGAIQLSLVEAAGLASIDRLTLTDITDSDDSYEAIVARGREVEGDRFDRRLTVYQTLRSNGVVPKTGFKFGADFRTYNNVESVSNLPHSEHLIRVVSPEHAFDPKELSLDVRLAGGVRKRMVFALTGANETITWLSVSRLTP